MEYQLHNSSTSFSSERLILIVLLLLVSGLLIFAFRQELLDILIQKRVLIYYPSLACHGVKIVYSIKISFCIKVSSNSSLEADIIYLRLETINRSNKTFNENWFIGSMASFYAF